jgi:hypothetical protein
MSLQFSKDFRFGTAGAPIRTGQIGFNFSF